jgi:hypothetical protein
MLKKVLFNIIKASLALGLLGWLVQSGKLNWNLLTEMQRYPMRLLMVFCLCFLNLLLVTWRWRYLLSARARQNIPLAGLGMVNWIGLFFGSVLPGSITGDFVKIFYVKKSDASLSTPFLLFSTFLDRVMGLTGLILLMGGFSVFNYSTLSALSPKLIPMLHFNFFLLVSITTGLIVFFLAPQVIEKLLSIMKVVVPNNKWPVRLQDLWKDLIGAKKQMGLAILISILIQFLGVVNFHLLVSPQYETALSLELVLSFIPLGFMALAIPIAPGGLGVGHAAFQTLFGFAGEMNGANFFNMYFVVTMAFNILGFIPWLISKRR